MSIKYQEKSLDTYILILVSILSKNINPPIAGTNHNLS